MDVKLNPSWKGVLSEEFSKDYFKDLVGFVKESYETSTVYPPGPWIFRALNECDFEKVKVVILGQDPYHGEGQANGLAFSVGKNVVLPPSLKNIFKELSADLDIVMSGSGDLSNWAKQGVLLLNATLTVGAREAGSHQNKGWENFTDAIIEHLSARREHLVFMLWGKYAQNKGELINKDKHLVLAAAHPSPFSADKGFFGCRHFSKANNYLMTYGVEEIDWKL